VVDTLRADAVSAYGHVAGTTPGFDALAERGVLYERAYANAPWTLPSHATLFTGLEPDQHGVDWSAPVAPETLETLAGRLTAAGYATFGVSENPWVGPATRLDQGFERFAGADRDVPDVVGEVRNWLAGRDPQRPFFVFVNVVDPHWPYEVRAEEPFLPPGATRADAESVSQWPLDYLCAATPQTRELAILHGLYLGEVAESDRKLAAVQAALAAAAGAGGLVTVATADHGEHFGEHAMAGHLFSVYEALLRVPLVVAGLPGVAAGRVAEPVQLADVAPTLLRVAGVTPPAALRDRGLALPGAPPAPPRDLYARFLDPARAPAGSEPPLFALARSSAIRMRDHCPPDAFVWGDLHALIRFPFKLMHSSRESLRDEVYDVAADPGEARDLAPQHPALTAYLDALLRRRLGSDSGAAPAPDAALHGELEALGHPEWR
jgi:arylsulfatase A-like enzyme